MQPSCVSIVFTCACVHVCACVLLRGCSTSHVIAVSRLQWQHQARCVDVPGYLEPNPPARLLTAASLTALTCQSYTAQLTGTFTITFRTTFQCFITLQQWLFVTIIIALLHKQCLVNVMLTLQLTVSA